MYGHKDGWRNKIIGKGHFAPIKKKANRGANNSPSKRWCPNIRELAGNVSDAAGHKYEAECLDAEAGQKAKPHALA